MNLIKENWLLSGKLIIKKVFLESELLKKTKVNERT